MRPLKLYFAFFLTSWLALSNVGSATDYQPWFGNAYEFRFGADYTYQYYPRLQSSGKHLKQHLPHNSKDNFLHTSLGFSPAPYVDTELEVQIANTSEHSFFVDYASLTGRYSVLDDVAGDPVSLSAGTTLSFASEKALRDFSTPHQGEAELSLHAAVGKEISRGASWLWHAWAMTGITVANHPHPALFGIASIERNIDDRHLLALLAGGSFGLGQKPLGFRKEFKGYGPIQHRSVDIAIKYSYCFEFWGRLSIEYAYRVFARNFPERNQCANFCYSFPFSLF